MIEERMKKLGFELPEVNKLGPQYKFTSVLIHENIAYISGALPKINGKLAQTGKLGDTVSIEEGQKLAELCILSCLASLKDKIGSLNNVKQVIKITGFVASATGFSQQADVMNAATNMLVDIFGEKGVHARSAIGAAVMPLNTPVEIEMIVAIED